MLLRLLGLEGASREAPPPGLTDAIAAHLRDLPPPRAELVAAFAGLLMRVAHADAQVSDAEDEALRHQIAEHASLGPDESAAVAELVTAHLRSMAGIDYASLTRAMNEHASVNDKLHLIDCLYGIATADDVVSVVEDEEIKAVARALLLSHSQLIDVRRRYTDALEVIRAVRRLRDG